MHSGRRTRPIRIGETIAFDTKNSTLYSSGKLVATIGIDNLIVVETLDTVLVCTKDKAKDIKKIVDEFKHKINKQTNAGSVVIAYDSRRMSKEFALDAALI